MNDVLKHALATARAMGFLDGMNPKEELRCVMSWFANPLDETRIKIESQAGAIFESQSAIAIPKDEPMVVVSTPKIDAFVEPMIERVPPLLVTSISPSAKRLDRHLESIKTWHAMGLDVVAVQNPSEITVLEKHFPHVDFVPVGRSSHVMYDKPSVLINDLANIAIKRKRNILIINADIELIGDFDAFLEEYGWVRPKTLTIGIRQNYRSDRSVAKFEPYGMDSFLLSPQMAQSLPDIALAIGIPYWDYWFPFHFRQMGFDIRLSESPHMFHKVHPTGWSESDFEKARTVFISAYPLFSTEIETFRDSIRSRPIESDAYEPYWPACPSEVDFSMPKQHAIKSMMAATSLSPTRIEEQQRAIASWKAVGLKVAAVQLPEEIQRCASLFEGIDYWIADDNPSTIYDRPIPRIKSIAMVASTFNMTTLLINSDIEIHCDQFRLRSIGDLYGKMIIGIRWNYNGEDRASAVRETYGLDAMVIGPEAAKQLPDLPLAIGKPMWDYWVPYHMKWLGHELEFIGEPMFFHQSHPIQWQLADRNKGARVLESYYHLEHVTEMVDFRRTLPFPPPPVIGMQE